MEWFHAIHGFLAAVRRRLRRRAASGAGLWALACVLGLLLSAPLIAAGHAGAAASVRLALLIAVCAALLALAIAGVLIPRRRFRADEVVAREVGRAAPHVASDLLSTVELQAELPRPRFSPDLAYALAESTARRVEILDPAVLVPLRLRRAVLATAGVALAWILCAAAAPRTLAVGWSRLVSPPRDQRILDAAAVAGPIVGDISMTLQYPGYTRRPPLTIPVSSGDVLAPRGTIVYLSTTALRAATSGRIVFDRAEGAPARGPAVPGRDASSSDAGADVPLVLDGKRLSASFTVDKPAVFRFLLQPPAGGPIIEADGHHVEIEADRAPRVELFAPADELDVSSRRRIELAYSIEDDYGLREIALVWRAQGGKEERKILPAPRAGSRTAQAKFFWDLSEVALAPGSRVAYHLEAKDNDDVAGPNVGSSRTFHLRIYSPRERHEQILARQQEVFEQTIALLGKRLTLTPEDHEPRRDALRAGERLVVDLGELIGLVEADALSPRKLVADLKGMHARLEKLARIAAPAGGPRRALPGGGRSEAEPPDQSKKWIPELERDVLMLDDWLERQRLEELLAITDEIRQHRDKLADLIAQYGRSKSDRLRAEIEREIKAIEQRIAELERKAAQLSGEVADRFVNADAMNEADDLACLQKVRKLVDAGDAAGAAALLKRCSEMLERQAAGLEAGLRGLRNDRFSEEEKAYSELMDEIRGLEEEQRGLAEQADEMVDRYKRAAAEATRDKANPHGEKAGKIAEKLKQELDGVPRDGMTPFSQEEIDGVKRRIDDVQRMIEERDVAEALEMARQAEQGIRIAEADVEDQRDVGEAPAQADDALERLARADGLAGELIDELEQATPSPEELMTPVDRRRLDELRRRQEKLRGEARRIGQRADKRKEQLPQAAGETAQRGLDEAAQQMERAEERMRARDPMEGALEAHGAADRLEQLRQGMQRSSRPTSVGNGRNPDDEPVRIPGSEEYRAPEAWREDILEGSRKGTAPKEYRDQVERYFQELIK